MIMRTSYLATALALGLGLAACARHDPPRREEPAARQVGREAYRAGEEIKHGAKKAARELRDAGKEFREGWSEARHEDPKPQRK